MKYTLYLDESGNFEDNGKTYKPSIVAGYLFSGDGLTEESARNIMYEVKCSKLIFSNIDIKHFHGMESIDDNTVEFMTKVSEKLSKKGGQLIAFVNEKSRKLVNTDVTYINVFAEGVIQLIKQLMNRDKGHVELNIYYAHRIHVKLKKETGENSRIEENEYRERIDERIILRLANLSQSMRSKIKYSLKTGNATKDAPLMLADIVNGVLRGLRNKLSREQLNRIENLNPWRFKTLENDSWEVIQRLIAEENIASALFRWYGEFYDELKNQFTDKFEMMIKEKISEISERQRKIQYSILSEQIKILVDSREYSIATNLLQRLIDKYIPFTKDVKIYNEQLDFDMHFFMLTIATHKGEVDAESEEISKCRSLVKKLPYTWENLEYYLNYKMREIEHLNNIFDFSATIGELNKLENILSNAVELIGMIDELDEFANNIKSTTLAKVLNSRGRIRCFGILDNDTYELALKDFENARKHFVEESDISRVYQGMTLLECVFGNYDKAIRMLALSVGIDDDITYEKIISAIQKDGKFNQFVLVQYVNIMTKWSKINILESGKMYTALYNSSVVKKVLEENNICYPVTVIKWRIARYLAMKGNNKALSLYRNARKQSLVNKKQYTIYAQGLSMWAEQLALVKIGNKEYLNELTELINIYDEFSIKIPVSMQKYFTDWHEILEACKSLNQIEAKEGLLKISNNIPII